MKRLLIQTAVLTASTTMLTSCFDEVKQFFAGSEPAPAEPVIEEPAAPAVPTQPTNEEISRMLIEQLSGCDAANAGTLTCSEPTTNPDSSISMNATLKMVVKEDMFVRETAPSAFYKEREAVNEAANTAMKPESVYLFQVGATTELITDADRAAKPLPENLLAPLNELKELAESSVYRKVMNTGDEVETTASFTAAYVDGAWQFSNIVVDNASLLALNDYTAQSALPQNAPILTPEFEESRKALIREKVAAFNQLAEPYIKGREEAARATLTEYQARAEEEARRITEQAAAEEAARQECLNAYVQLLADDKLFAGEWTRDKQFGELSLHIETAKRLDNAVQFSGTIFDTNLPEASLQIIGRCELLPKEDGTTQVDISIYDGQYDPDQPTAEVYDAKDGMITLQLSKDGKLNGIMSCAAWASNPEKAFKVTLSPKAKEEPRNRRRRR
jgi:hypothetical protein